MRVCVNKKKNQQNRYLNIFEEKLKKNKANSKEYLILKISTVDE